MKCIRRERPENLPSTGGGKGKSAYLSLDTHGQVVLDEHAKPCKSTVSRNENRKRNFPAPLGTVSDENMDTPESVFMKDGGKTAGNHGLREKRIQKRLKKSRKWLGKPLAIWTDMVYNKPVVCSGMKW